MLRRVSVWAFGEEGEILVNAGTQALIAASTVLVMGTVLLSPLIADLAGVLAVSEAYAGWLIIGYTAGSAVTLPVVGVLADRIGRKPILVTGLGIFGLAGAAVGALPRFEAAVVFRALQGVGFAAAFPVVLALLGDLYSGSRETTVQGIRVSVNSVAHTIAPLLASLLFVYSWRYPFAIYLLAIPSAIWIWFAVPAIESAHDWTVRTYLHAIAAFLRNVSIAMLMLSFFARFILFYGLITYFSVLAVREARLAVVAVGGLLAILNVAKTIVSAQAGRLSLSVDPAVLALVGFVLAGSGTFLMGAVPTTGTLVVAAVVWGVGDGIMSPCQKSLVNRLSSAEYRGGAMSTALLFQNAGKVVGPVGVGMLLGLTGPAVAFVLLGIVGGGLGTAAMLGVVLWTDA